MNAWLARTRARNYIYSVALLCTTAAILSSHAHDGTSRSECKFKSTEIHIFQSRFMADWLSDRCRRDPDFDQAVFPWQLSQKSGSISPSIPGPKPSSNRYWSTEETELSTGCLIPKLRTAFNLIPARQPNSKGGRSGPPPQLAGLESRLSIGLYDHNESFFSGDVATNNLSVCNAILIALTSFLLSSHSHIRKHHCLVLCFDGKCFLPHTIRGSVTPCGEA